MRVADDIADHAALTPDEKLALLDRLEADLLRQRRRNPEAVALRKALAERGLSPRHAQDLLTAFRMDVTKLRYRDWDDLIGVLHLFGHAGRPLCAATCMARARDVAGQRRALRGAADHQPSAGLSGRLSQSKPRLCATELALAMHVADKAADRHGRIGAVPDQIIPVAIAQLGDVEPERGQQILGVARR